jgi:hypothetical protein
MAGGIFGALRVEETAEVLGISRATVTADWRMAKAWLFRELADETDGPRTLEAR